MNIQRAWSGAFTFMIALGSSELSGCKPDGSTTARVDRARELLETHDWGADRVAAESGLGTAANLRVHFRRIVGVSPSGYRRTFG